MTPPKFHLEIVSNIDRFECLKEEWNALETAKSTPMCRWEWFYAAVLSFHCHNHLKTLVVRREGRIAAIAPLVEFSVPVRSYLAFIGIEALHEPCDLVYNDVEALDYLLKYIGKIGRPFYFEYLQADSSTNQRIDRVLKGKGIVIQKKAGLTCFLPMLQRSWEDFLAGLPSKRRYDVRRVYKRVEEAGPIHFELISPDLTALPGLLDKVFSIEARSWKGEAGTAILSNPQMETFFRRYCALAVEEGYLRIALLSLKDSLAAVLIGADFGNRFWVFKIGYDAQWSRYSPGSLLINETVRYAFQKGHNAYEFLGTDESWIHLWTGRENLHPHILIAFYPYNLQGIMRLATDAGKFTFNKTSYALRNLQKGFNK